MIRRTAVFAALLAAAGGALGATAMIHQQEARIKADSIEVAIRGLGPDGNVTAFRIPTPTVAAPAPAPVPPAPAPAPAPVPPPAPAPAPAPVPPPTPPPSGAGLVFASDWSTGTGTSNAALTDGGKWTRIDSYASGWGTVVARSATTAAGNAPPRGNVLRVHYDRSGNVALPNGLPSLPIGGTVYITARLNVGIRDAVGAKSQAPHHPLQSLSGNCAHEWAIKIGPLGNGKYSIMLATSAAYPANGWVRGGEPGWTGSLNKNTWYAIGLSLTRTAAGKYRAGIRLDGRDDGANWAQMNGPLSANLAALKPEFPISDACAKHLFLGNNGPGWSGMNPTLDVIEWATVEVRTDRWPE